MNEKKIVFIICVNDEIFFEECIFYIEKLQIPTGYTIEIISIREADSMCAAYNEGMNVSDAKYKVYMHQDVFIRENGFLLNVMKIFKNNPEVGMIGMVGGTNIPSTGIVFDTWNVGKVDVREPDMAYFMHTDEKIKDDKEVCAIDGMMIVTQYDLPWREDIFSHFDFYDISQSCEFRRAGYKIIVPYQKIPWVIHDCGFAKLKNYNIECEKFLKEYAEFINCERSSTFVYENERESLCIKLEQQIKKMIEYGAWNEAENALEIYHQVNYRTSGLEELNVIVEIYSAERNKMKQSFFSECRTIDQMREKYYKLRFLLRRVELKLGKELYEDLTRWLTKDDISYEAIAVMIKRAAVDKVAVIEYLVAVYKECGNRENYDKAKKLLSVVMNKKISVAYSKGVNDIL